MQPLPDFPQHVERTESVRERHLQVLAFDVANDDFEWTVRDVIEELEALIDDRATMSRSEFREAVRDQVRRLIG